MFSSWAQAIRDDLDTLFRQAEEEYGEDGGEYAAGYFRAILDARDVVLAHAEGGKAEPK